MLVYSLVRLCLQFSRINILTDIKFLREIETRMFWFQKIIQGPLILLIILAYTIKTHPLMTWSLKYWRKTSVLLLFTSFILTIFLRSCILPHYSILTSLFVHLLF